MMSQIARATRRASLRDSPTVVLRMTLPPQEGVSGGWSGASGDSDAFVEFLDIGHLDQLARTNRIVMPQKSSGGSYAEIIEPNTQNKRTSLHPSKIEETAMIINELMNSNEDNRSGHNYVSSVSDFTPISDRSCLGRISATPLRMAQLAETRSPSDTSGGISLLQEIRRSGISAVNNPDDWIALDVTVDSGACVTVMPSGLCPGIQIMENDLSRNGVEYEVANGESIANLGEKRSQVMTIGSRSPKKIVFQIADVHKPLLSVTACSDMGYDRYLGKEGGSLRDRVTGEIIPLERRGSLYTLRMWVRQWSDERPSPGFPGPA